MTPTRRLPPLPFSATLGGLTQCLAVIAMLAVPGWAAARQLQSVEAVAGGGNGVTLRLTLDGPAPETSSFTVDQPARLSIDLPDTALAVDQRYQRIDRGPVTAVALAAAGGRTRVVVELQHMVDYHIERDGNEVRVALGARSQRSPATDATRPGAPSATGAAAPAGTNGPSVEGVDFRRGENGAGRVILDLAGVDAPVDVSDTGGRIVARLAGVTLPARLQKRYDVLDFATPVKSIDAVSRDGGTRVVITPTANADYEQIAYQTGNQFIIELAPVSETEQARREAEKPEYTGEKISLSFQNIDVRAVLQIVADVADVNMVVADSVTGQIALRLEDVPWDQALDIILKARNLGMRRVNNVISVAPLSEIAAREQAELAAQQATKNLAPLRSEIIQINYARAADIAALLQSTRASAPGPSGLPGQVAGSDVSLLSDRGRVTVDDRTNSLLINDSREKLEEIRRVIDRLDRPVRQVLIESRIVVANREFQRNLGVSQSVVDQGDLAGGDLSTQSGYTVALPAANTTSTLSTSILGDSFSLNLELSAMESENKGEIISSPRVITADGQQARIEQGREIPFLEAASSGAATVEFKKAVLSLTVTPQITPDNQVIMNLRVTQDSQGETVNVQGGGAVPSINTRSLTTQVLVGQGDTVVLGGIYEQENRDQDDRVPILGELPLVGALFRGTQRQRDKRELLIFVTPKILDDKLKL